LKGRGIVVDLFPLFLNDEWGMWGYEEGKVMMKM
jgi:hypothetical protein